MFRYWIDAASRSKSPSDVAKLKSGWKTRQQRLLAMIQKSYEKPDRMSLCSIHECRIWEIVVSPDKPETKSSSSLAEPFRMARLRKLSQSQPQPLHRILIAISPYQRLFGNIANYKTDDREHRHLQHEHGLGSRSFMLISSICDCRDCSSWSILEWNSALTPDLNSFEWSKAVLNISSVGGQ